ncbi:hypothetical protein AGMMS50256_32960 [Betaproteobacteria bacterium]|nr:hypothetical protein AGMMS50256_32960 [Betaproteobacteria bacterium]
MKIFLFVLFALMASLSVYGQEIVDHWNGVLKIQGAELPLNFHIDKTEKGYSALMDSLAQGAKDIPVTTVVFENSTLK